MTYFQVTVSRTTTGSNGYIWSVTFDTPTEIGGVANAGDQPAFHANGRKLGATASIEVRIRHFVLRGESKDRAPKEKPWEGDKLRQAAHSSYFSPTASGFDFPVKLLYRAPKRPSTTEMVFRYCYRR